MKLGLDYWQVISHYPEYFQHLIDGMTAQGDEVHVVSAVGRARAGTVAKQVANAVTGYAAVHEVVFDHPRDSPRLKLEKCRELGISAFYDDRDDVCRLLNSSGIIAMRVTRRDNSSYDLSAEIGASDVSSS